MNHRPIQRILVPLDPSDYSKAATRRACEVARAHAATVSALAVLDTPEIAGTALPGDLTYWPAVHEVVSALTEDARERIDAAQSCFVAACESERVAHKEARLQGVPDHLILEASVLYDLVVIGLRTFFHFETRETDGDALERILGRSVTPVLAVPCGHDEDADEDESEEGSPDRRVESFQKVAVAFDGSFAAGRALRDFAAFAAPYEFRVTLITAHEEAAQAEHLLAEAGAALRVHGIEPVDSVHIPESALTPDRVVAIDEADLVVCGAHSRNLVRDLFVGSFTRDLIRRGDKAVFLSH